jgi:putative membrane protein
MNFVFRWLGSSIGFLTAIFLIRGINAPTPGGPWDIIAIALIAGLANVVLTPIFRFFTFPFIILTFGLWLFVLNVLLFWLVGYLGREFGFGFTIDGVLPAVLGSIVVSIVSTVLNQVLVKRK